ncbi:class I SAM-dependent methyltransferase [Shewanella subflava]|uniref:Class I SAM-dependent methyltransferase n=1 Tax=Shewanella subflava TaxID=2986476 RepID=A0ABT3I4S9_9GAMM|nr:class I SAM-dependent methyltransferase [Shewanella subflava]MCW3171076.1 class I SAM-dependent methyltransferase [Shewanella subflava]
MTQHWSDYWKQGYVTSFGSELQQNYQGELKVIWETFATKLPANFNLLDLCTGNASLPLLIQDCLSQHDTNGQIIAVDQAQVNLDPNRHTNSNIDIKLISGVNCEVLPFESETFDFCISQFGIEYSSILLTLSEIARVLKIKGQCLFVLHHIDSRILKANQKIYQFITQPYVQSLLGNMSKLIVAMGEVQTHDDVIKIKQNKECEALRHQINKDIKSLVQTDESTAKESELMMYVGQFFTQGMFWPVSRKNEFIDFIEQEISSSKQRLCELINAAVDNQKLNSILCEASKLNLVVLRSDMVVEGGEPIAYILSLQKDNTDKKP